MRNYRFITIIIVFIAIISENSFIMASETNPPTPVELKGDEGNHVPLPPTTRPRKPASYQLYAYYNGEKFFLTETGFDNGTPCILKIYDNNYNVMYMVDATVGALTEGIHIGYYTYFAISLQIADITYSGICEYIP